MFLFDLDTIGIYDFDTPVLRLIYTFLLLTFQQTTCTFHCFPENKGSLNGCFVMTQHVTLSGQGFKIVEALLQAAQHEGCCMYTYIDGALHVMAYSFVQYAIVQY